MSSDTVRPKRQELVLVDRSVDGTLMCIAPDVAPVVLNDTAMALWELCDGTTSIHEMVEAVCELFAIPADQATLDVDRALDQMRSAGLLQ